VTSGTGGLTGAAGALGGWTPALRPVLRVGVVGHRELGEAQDRVSRSLHALFGAIRREAEAAAPGFVDGPGPVDLMLVTALAPGADLLAAEAALGHGYRLRVVLPCEEERYLTSFEDQGGRPAEEWRERARACLRRPGTSGLIGDGAGLVGTSRDGLAYREVARMILDGSDLLVAVVGPERGAERGGAGRLLPGGSHDALDLALGRGDSVLWIDPDAPGIRPELLSVQDGILRRREAGAQLQGQIARILVPHPDDAGILRRLLAELRRTPGTGTRPWQTPWRWLERYARRGESCVAAPPPPASLEAPRRGLQAWARAADDHAVDLALDYRGYLVTLNLLGALAILFGVLSVSPLGRLAAAVELATVTVVWLLWAIATRRHWRDRAIEMRVLAEALRGLLVLAPYGHARPRLQPPVHDPSGGPRAVAWLVRAIVRACPFSPDGLFSLAEAGASGTLKADLLRWVEDQRDYHHRAARRFGRVESILHRSAFGLLAGATLCVIVHVFWAHEGFAFGLLVGGAVVLPAFVAAAHATDTQGEFGRAARRSAALRDHLDSWRGRVEAPLPESSDADHRLAPRQVRPPAAPAAHALAEHARALSEVLFAENLDWRATLLGREVAPH
jgi:hypothetical protein